MDLLKYKQIVESELFCIGPMVAFIWENSPLWPVKAISSNILTLYGYTQEEFLEATLKYAEVIVKRIDRESLMRFWRQHHHCKTLLLTSLTEL